MKAIDPFEFEGPRLADSLTAGAGNPQPGETRADEEFRGHDWSQATIDGAHFDGCRLHRLVGIGLEARHCTINHVVVDGGDYSGARFDEASFDRVEVLRAKARGSVWVGTKLSRARFIDVMLEGAEFGEAEIDRAIFRDCDLSHADFSGAKLRRVRFERCWMAGATFARAGLMDVDLTTSLIDDLRSAAGLRGATITVSQSIGLVDRLARELGVKVVEG